MLTFRDMTLEDRDTVLPMVDAFYRSNAVDHPVPRMSPCGTMSPIWPWTAGRTAWIFTGP